MSLRPMSLNCAGFLRDQPRRSSAARMAPSQTSRPRRRRCGVLIDDDLSSYTHAGTVALTPILLSQRNAYRRAISPSSDPCIAPSSNACTTPQLRRRIRRNACRATSSLFAEIAIGPMRFHFPLGERRSDGKAGRFCRKRRAHLVPFMINLISHLRVLAVLTCRSLGTPSRTRWRWHHEIPAHKRERGDVAGVHTLGLSERKGIEQISERTYARRYRWDDY